MKTRSFARVVAASLALASLSAVGVAWQPAGQPSGQPPVPPPNRAPGGQPGGQPGERGPGGRGAGQQISVEFAMKGMNRAMKQLNNQVADASKKDENLKLINDVQRGCVGAKGMPVPEDILAKAKDDAAKTKLQQTYRARLMELLRLSLDAEQSIIDGKTDDAGKTISKMIALRDSAHTEMGVKEE